MTNEGQEPEEERTARARDEGEGAGEGLPPSAPPFKDRKVGLIVFGVLLLLVAALLLAMAALQVVMIFGAETLAPGVETSPAMSGIAAVVYVLLAAAAAWLGIGSIRCRRWARALTLVLSWLGLVVGVLGSILMISMAKLILAQAEGQMGGPNPAASFTVGCMLVGIGFFYIILPAAFVLFYRSRHVKATCEHYDPQSRWTDRYPLPVLAGGVLLLSMSGVLLTPLLRTPLPFFGLLLTGAGAWIFALVVGGAALALAWGFFRLERWAWLGALVLMALNGLSTWITFRGDRLSETYEQMNVPVEQLESMEAAGFLTTLPLMIGLSVLVTLLFYLWLGRYFHSRAAS